MIDNHDLRLEPPGSYTAGNFDATCDGYLPETMRVAPRDLTFDLARIDESVLIAGHAAHAGAENPEALAHSLAAISRRINAMLEEARDMPNVIDVECGFEGAVDAEFQRLGRGFGNAFWTCPRCGTEHTTEIDGDDR